ncbi:hypothetical protein FIBSPDRAFT_835995 [Athelia psychrophila]|uniref:Zn(2)-C6 fungal-type domain-containing protein n=1 Tax=Athelia psychrophila TaxID=1759441 RepID=A0A166BE24_9AGAM|nr:hypothetical protein FIBSPDRAFT_835995 [Fibularhizoctonia sp. CBS 109695]
MPADPPPSLPSPQEQSKSKRRKLKQLPDVPGSSSLRSTLDDQDPAPPAQPQYYIVPGFPNMGSNGYASFPGSRPAYPHPHPQSQSPHPATPAIPAHFSYPPHYPPPPHGYYAPYAPHPMAMYGAPPPQGTPTPRSSTAPSPISASAPPAKRKRKSTAGRDDSPSDQEAGGSGSDRPRATSQAASAAAAAAAAAAEMKKRTKTQRACDSCRSRKIRCDLLVDAEPPSCQHCKQYGFECTFFLPITETRFKKKKTEEAAAGQDKDADKDPRAETNSPHVEAKRDPRVFGPTAEVHLLHSQAGISSRIYESYDQRYHHTWEVSKTGDGLIQIDAQATDEAPSVLPKAIDVRIERDVVEKLLNAYFTDVAPIFPVVTKAEFLSSASPPPMLLYSMCLVAAARRDVPQSLFDSIRFAVNGIIKSEDVLSTASITNVQALLILCMTGDCHSQFVPNALSALWVRLGTAIRMAQDLGLHRAESVKQNIELRRRLWGACVISDRWTSLTYGHPYMIDVADCDVRLPSSGDPNDLYMDELVRLSVLLGRVLKTIYSPSGLTFTTDTILHALIGDLEAWKTNLPEKLRFTGAETSTTAGLLHILYCCVCMIFWRVFMRISYSCPDHLKFGLTVDRWSALIQLTGDAIDWLDTHERLYDVWLLVPYAATSCALVQYHTWARRRDVDAAAKLRKLRDCVRRWEGSISPDHMSARRKTAEIIALLYEATQGPPAAFELPALNPTGGVVGKPPPPVNGLKFQKDPSRQGSGIFIATAPTQKEDYADLLPGVMVAESEIRDKDKIPDDNENNTSTGGPMPAAASSMVNFTPLGEARPGGMPANVNPAMENVTSSRVQVLNVLDVPQGSQTLEQFAMADNGFLEGIPGGMFDWGQWDTFFTRFNASLGHDGAGGMSSMYRPEQPQQAQPTPDEYFTPGNSGGE